MNQAIRMLIVLSAITVVSGAALGGLHGATWEIAENNVLRFKKIPAVVTIHEGLGGALDEAARAALGEKLLAGKRTVELEDGAKLLFFVIEQGDEARGVALEGFGQGFGGKLGAMAGVDLKTGELLGAGVTTMSETPGVGTRVHEPDFLDQFAGVPADKDLKVKKEGGEIDVISGASVSSRAVTDAVRGARATFEANKDAIIEAAMEPPPSPQGEEVGKVPPSPQGEEVTP